MPEAVTSFISGAVPAVALWVPFNITVRDKVPGARKLVDASAYYPQAAICRRLGGAQRLLRQEPRGLRAHHQGLGGGERLLHRQARRGARVLQKKHYQQVPLADLKEQFAAQKMFTSAEWRKLYADGTVTKWLQQVTDFFVALGEHPEPGAGVAVLRHEALPRDGGSLGMDRTIAFIGLGTMGRPMASNLLKGGLTIRAFDIVPGAVDALASAGATPTGSPAEAAQGADVVITMLPNSSHVDEAVFGLGGIAEGIAPGALYIDMSTIAPAMTDSLAGRLAERGVAMVDAPVGRQQQHAIEGKLLIMVGGKASDLERARPVLERMGDTIVHCGPVGAGSRMKIVNNFMSTTLNVTTAEALTLAEASGLDVEVARKVMLGTAAGLGHLGTTYPAKVLKGDLAPGFMVDLALKDLRLAIELGQSLGLPLQTGRSAERAYDAAAKAGYGRNDWSALYAYSRKSLQGSGD